MRAGVWGRVVNSAIQIDADIQMGFQVDVGDVSPLEYRALQKLHRARDQKMKEDEDARRP